MTRHKCNYCYKVYGTVEQLQNHLEVHIAYNYFAKLSEIKVDPDTVMKKFRSASDVDFNESSNANPNMGCDPKTNLHPEVESEPKVDLNYNYKHRGLPAVTN